MTMSMRIWIWVHGGGWLCGGLMEIKEREVFVCFGELNLGIRGKSLNSFDNSMGSQFGSGFEQDGLYWF